MPAPGWFLRRGGRARAPACHYGGVAHTSASAGMLLRHVRTGRARSRADLVALTGASRNTVSARVDQLIAANLLEEGGRGWSTGGRPPTLLQFNSRAGLRARRRPRASRASTSPSPTSPREILATVGHPIDIADGPEPVLAEVDRLAQQVLAEAGLTPGRRPRRGRRRARPGGVLDRPALAPADHAGLARLPDPERVRPLRVPRLRRQRRERDGPGRDRDRRLRSRTCSSSRWAPASAAGSSSTGRVYRGAQGSAGDIGHIYVAQPDGRTVICRCGNENCLEAIAGGDALLRDALAAGLPVGTTRGGRRARRPGRRPGAGAGPQRRAHDRHRARRRWSTSSTRTASS